MLLLFSYVALLLPFSKPRDGATSNMDVGIAPHGPKQKHTESEKSKALLCLASENNQLG